MTYVVTEACIGCRYGECVTVCPQNAFHAGENFVVINPKTCANCALCEMVCPVSAIRAATDVPPEQREYIQLNARLSAQWPLAAEIEPLPDADEKSFLQNKRELLKIA